MRGSDHRVVQEDRYVKLEGKLRDRNGFRRLVEQVMRGGKQWWLRLTGDESSEKWLKFRKHDNYHRADGWLSLIHI